MEVGFLPEEICQSQEVMSFSLVHEKGDKPKPKPKPSRGGDANGGLPVKLGHISRTREG